VTADGGGLVTAALRPVQGAGQIARFYAGITGRALNAAILERTVSGQPGLAAQPDGVATVFAFDIAGDRITHIWAVRNPGKLRPWTTGRHAPPHRRVRCQLPDAWRRQQIRHPDPPLPRRQRVLAAPGDGPTAPDRHVMRDSSG
jgi:RNA polymerase sigma-70 factor (ECF subfamily)